MSIYLDLTREFNAGRLRAVVTSGQAVVLHRLAIMSKDGDWILREDEEALEHVLRVLDRRGARYRFGAPLDLRWMRGGWSAHLEFQQDVLRVRTDFFTRPPRVTAADLERVFVEQAGHDPAVVDLRTLADMKKTNREKDYAVIGELARRMTSPSEQLLYSRSARDLQEVGALNPELARTLARERPLLAQLGEGRERLEAALDAERRELIRANERRLEAFQGASRAWAAAWPAVSREIEARSLLDAHRIVIARASGLLPSRVENGAR